MACSPRAKHLVEPVQQGAGEERHALLVRPRRLAAQVDDADLGQRPARDALGQEQTLESARLRRVPRLHRRRRRAQDQGGAVFLRAQRDTSRASYRGDSPLLVGAVVLLVHDEQPGVGHRRERRGPRTDHRARVARAHALPRVGALALGQRGVQDGGERAELARELAREDGRQRDLGHQPHRAAARVERRPDRAQVDLRLAAARHALEEHRVEPPLDDRATIRARADSCAGVGAWNGTPARVGDRRLAPLLLEAAEQPALGQHLEHPGPGAGGLADLRRGRRPPDRVEVLEDVPAAAAALAERRVARLARRHPRLVGMLHAPRDSRADETARTKLRSSSDRSASRLAPPSPGSSTTRFASPPASMSASRISRSAAETEPGDASAPRSVTR
jgi:hypothetical protein